MSAVGTNEFVVHAFGPHIAPLFGPMNAAETFGAGSPVFINNEGELEQPPADGTEILVADVVETGRQGGIACFGPADLTGIDFRTGLAYATGARIQYHPWDRGIVFRTRNLISAAGTDVVPTGAMVGESFQITFDNVITPAANRGWSIETTAGVGATDVCAVILSVLDVRMAPISATDTTTGVWLLFHIKTSLV